MLYNGNIDKEAIASSRQLNKLIAKGAKYELVEKFPLRGNQQNKYLHVLFGAFAMKFGYSMKETKILIKRELGYIYEKNGIKFLMETSKMDSKELTIFIEKFRKYSADNGLYLPEPYEKELLFIIEQEMESNKEWL